MLRSIRGLLRTRRRRLVAALILTLVTVLLAVAFGGPPPPRRIVFATGQAGGMYDRLGDEYRTRLRALGLEVRLLLTRGSVDNLGRLSRREADVAFVQSGTYSLVPDPEKRLQGIAALYLEPMWIFYRGAGRPAGGAPVAIGAFAGKRIGVGPKTSGTEAVARALLREHGMDGSGQIMNLTSAEQHDRLLDGTLDVGFFVTSYRDTLVSDLLRRREVALLGFPHPVAYLRRVPGLTALTLSEGQLDLKSHVPPAEITLLSPVALLVSRADLHPRAVELLLTVARQLHAPGSLVDAPGHFPSLEGVDLPLHEASVYVTERESFLSRTLPYGLLRWALLFRVLVISLVVWIPLLRIVLEVARWRDRRRLNHLYDALRGIESALVRATTAQEIDAQIEKLAALTLSSDTPTAKRPGNQPDVYQWQMHVAHVRDEARARREALEAPAPERRRTAR